MIRLKFVLLPEVNGISKQGAGTIVRLYIYFSLFLDNILILVAPLRCCFDCSSSLCFVNAIFVLKLIPSSQKRKLSNRKAGASTAPKPHLASHLATHKQTMFLQPAKHLDSRNLSKMAALHSSR